jgi:enoyl-CoA hydratase/carnithine racemase
LSFGREFIKSPQDSLDLNQLMYDAIERMTKLPLITMAIATGGAICGGSELITGFDFICMSKESGFVHFVQTRMGVSSPWGGMHRLIDIVGRKKALLWMAGGRKIRAEQGYKDGLVDLIVEKDDDCLNETLKFLSHFVVEEKTQQKVSAIAVRGMKKLSVNRKDGSNWEYVSKVFSGSAFSKL